MVNPWLLQVLYSSAQCAIRTRVRVVTGLDDRPSYTNWAKMMWVSQCGAYCLHIEVEWNTAPASDEFQTRAVPVHLPDIVDE